MTPRPLSQIRLHPSDHPSALWWLGLLYRRPRGFCDALWECARSEGFVVVLCLCLHLLPYILILIAASRLVRFGVLRLRIVPRLPPGPDTLAFDISGNAVAIVFGVLLGILIGIVLGIPCKVVFRILGGVTYAPSNGIVVRIASAIVLASVVSLVFGTAMGIAVAIGVLRCYYHVVHPIFLSPLARGSWYRFHPVAWDDLCAVPFPRMDRLLVAYVEHSPDAGEKEIERLIVTYPSQRKAAFRAWTRLVAREARRTSDLTRIGHTVAKLPARKGDSLKETPQLQEMVVEIADLQARLNAAAWPDLPEPIARLLRARIEILQHRAAAAQWLAIAERQLQEAQAGAERVPTPQVFRAGDTVDPDREAFVPRDGVVAKLEQQMRLCTGCPGIVIYGRRRMGKSTVLRNLEGFLPPKVRSVTISMQQAEAFISLESLVVLLDEAIHRGWPSSRPPEATPRGLTGLSRLLTECNNALESEGRRLIVAFDEYENIDRGIGKRIFPEDLLAVIRESIHTHRNLFWAFAGSHEIHELKNAPWTSYLVSARTIEVPPFTVTETCQLLTEPLKFSTREMLQRGTRLHPSFLFPVEFWGRGGIERIHAEAAGWPHLVQLIAETVVDLLNDEGRRQVAPELFERALDESIVRGDIVLYELMCRESDLPGEWEYLSAFRKQETQPPPEDDAVARSLRRRLLVSEEGEGGPWRLRVPLMRRWLLKRG